MDLERLFALAALAQRAAEDTRAVAADVAGARGVAWQSVQAEHYRDDLAREASAVRRGADALDRAAAALRLHAQEVQRRLGEMRALQHWFDGALDDARRCLAAAGASAAGAATAGLADAGRLVAAAAQAPPPGSPQWGPFVAGLR